MKTIILLLALATTALAETALDQPAKAGGRVFTKDAFWNKTYREERRRNPGGNEALWCAAADAKEKERMRRATGFTQNTSPVRVFIYR
jgi:hypothetical protein